MSDITEDQREKNNAVARAAADSKKGQKDGFTVGCLVFSSLELSGCLLPGRAAVRE